MKKVFQYERIMSGNRQPATGNFHINRMGVNVQEYFIILFLFMMLCFLCPISALAQIEISSSPNPVGSGARALGMGGAFIGVADDATAASWNPGGLVQLPNPEISVVMNGFHRAEDNIFGSNPEASGTQSVTEKDINYFSVVYPFNLFERNMIVSLSYQNLFDFTREWSFPLIYTDDLVKDDLVIGTATTNELVDYHQKGNLTALGLAYCIQIVPQFSFGFTLNFWDDDLTENKWESNRTFERKVISSIPGYPQFPPTFFQLENRDEYSFSGINANIGMLWRTTGRLTTGAVLKLPFTGDLKHKRIARRDGVDIIDEETDEKMDMPMSWGIGIAYRFSDKFTLSADLYRTEWQDYKITDADGKEASPITGDISEVNPATVDPTHQIRFGMEYLFINPELDYVIPLRAGIFYDPAPSEGSPDDYYGVSLGSGIAVGKFIFDFAYQYRFGNNVGSSVVRSSVVRPPVARSPIVVEGEKYDFCQDVDEHMIYSSLIIHF